jgi:acetyltransferase-like isoleucine patch superfamily enzyme
VRTYLIDTPRSEWTEGKVHGLGDDIADATVLGRTLADWYAGAEDAGDVIEGPALVIGGDLWVSPGMQSAFVEAAVAAGAVARLGRDPEGPGRMGDPLGRLPRDDEGRVLYDLWFVPERATREELEGAKPVDVVVRSRTFEMPADEQVMGTRMVPMEVSKAACCPVSHWAELLRANLLAISATQLDRPRWLQVLRYLWAALRAGSLRLEKALGKFNKIGDGCTIHPSAVLEGCVVGDFVTIGAGAYLRGCVVADDARVEAQALCDLSYIGKDAHIQRRAHVGMSVILEEARVGGFVQVSVVGRRAATKVYSVTTDMKVEGRVKVDTPLGLREIDIGYLGTCFGHGSFVGSGVWLAPGRVIAEGQRLARKREDMTFAEELR